MASLRVGDGGKGREDQEGGPRPCSLSGWSALPRFWNGLSLEQTTASLLSPRTSNFLPEQQGPASSFPEKKDAPERGLPRAVAQLPPDAAAPGPPSVLSPGVRHPNPWPRALCWAPGVTVNKCVGGFKPAPPPAGLLGGCLQPLLPSLSPLQPCSPSRSVGTILPRSPAGAAPRTGQWSPEGLGLSTCAPSSVCDTLSRPFLSAPRSPPASGLPPHRCAHSSPS